MKKYLALLMLALLAFVQARGEGMRFCEPDFDYPAKVEKNALALLAKAESMEAPQAGLARLRALIELCRAQRSIDPDSVYSQPAKVAALIDAPGNTDADRAMLMALQAKLYSGIYRRDRWNFDRVDAPLEPLPADVSEWSGEQFRSVIMDLYRRALDVEAVASTPVTVYSDVIEYSDEAPLYLPTVRDFILYQKYCFVRDTNFSEMWKKAALADVFAEALDGCKENSDPFFFWNVAKIRVSSSDSDDLFSFYQPYSGIEAARYALAAAVANCYSSIRTIEDDRPMVEAIRESLRQFPKWWGNKSLQAALEDLTSPVMEVECPRIVVPGHAFEVKVEYAFAKSLTCKLYYFGNEQPRLSGKQIVAKKRPVASWTADTLPGASATVSFTPEKEGRYAIVTCLGGERGTDYSVLNLLSTSFLPFVFTDSDKNTVATLNAADGSAAAGVDVIASYERQGSSRAKTPESVSVGKTDSQGLLSFSLLDKNAYLSFERNGLASDFDRNFYIWKTQRYNNSKSRVSAVILTDRPIYHPGDTIHWAVVGARKDGGTHLMADSTMKIMLRNPNLNYTDTCTAVADKWGRACGSFAIPQGGLTGIYGLMVVTGGDVFDNDVMVSDFRPPVFYAEITSVLRGVPSAGCVRIEGRARTFSGMPVADARVDVSLSSAPRWWRSTARYVIATYDITTDASGNFSIDFTPSDLTPDNEDDADFIVDFNVTARDASTASVTASFSLGKPYALQLDMTPSADTSSPVPFTVKALDTNGKQSPLNVEWSLAPMLSDEKYGDPVLTGSTVCGTPSAFLADKLAPGIYGMTVTPVDTALAAVLKPQEIILYNVAEELVPRIPSRPLFVPETSVRLDADGHARVLAGVCRPTDVLIVVSGQGSVNSVRTMRLPAGFSRIPVDFLPSTASQDNLRMDIYSVDNGSIESCHISFSWPEEASERLETVVFRDRITPGASETWRIRLCSRGDSAVLKSAAVATMYNAALENLVDDNWAGRFSLKDFSGYIHSNTLGTSPYSRSMRVDASNDDRYRGIGNIQWPDWRFLSQVIMIRGMASSRKYAAAAGGGVNNMIMSEASVTVAADMDSAADAESEEECSAVLESAPASDETDYRQADVLQAFWMPSLVSDDEGNIDIVFTVPNANGTWRFRSFAWSHRAESAALSLRALANKPVMVQPNLPRYLRQGDSVRLLATVYNNSDADAEVETTVEIFDIASGAVLESSATSALIAAGASAIVPVDMAAPTDKAAVGYRVRSRLGSFSDGEQTVIPILPSSATVIESTEFYLNPGDTAPFTLTVPASGNATLTLQYCQNPVWTMVKAMRGLGGGDGLTSVGISGRLFSALAARKVIADNPQVASVISQWKDNPSEEALTSMLSRNADLKKLMLDQTPWVQAAADQTARMAALADVLDPSATAKSIADYTLSLRKLQNADGGLRWTSWGDRSSLWASREALYTLGIARSLGMLPQGTDKELETLLSKVWNYIQTETLKQEKPETDWVTAAIASRFPDFHVREDMRPLLRRTLDDLETQWKGASVVAKARSLIVLKAYGRDAVCREIFSSIREFAVDRPATGKCFPSVNDIRAYATIIMAYKAMDAPASEIDALRQWVIVQAQASGDVFACNPDYVIASVMLTGTCWTDVPAGDNVRVDGAPVRPGKVESATGYFSQELSGKGKKLTVTVLPNGATPSYGSVISISRRPMSGIKARPGRDLSIEKRVLVQRNGKWVETSDFALGERLQVQLVIKAKRALSYVTIDDERPAAFEPVEQLPGYVYADGLSLYRENLDASTRLFVSHMPAGTYHIAYEMTANVAGRFISGVATLQSQYAPELTAHSSAATVTVE